MKHTIATNVLPLWLPRGFVYKTTHHVTIRMVTSSAYSFHRIGQFCRPLWQLKMLIFKCENRASIRLVNVDTSCSHCLYIAHALQRQNSIKIAFLLDNVLVVYVLKDRHTWPPLPAVWMIGLRHRPFDSWGGGNPIWEKNNTAMTRWKINNQTWSKTQNFWTVIIMAK
jgi:hypothetical protein